MSDERIDIEVNDKVDAGVETKLRSIAAAARDGATGVDKLKRALRDVDTTALSRLADASAKTTNALAREMNAQARLTNATNAGAMADAKAQIAKTRLAAESAKVAAAQQRLAQETARAQGAAARAAATEAQAATAILRQEAAQRRAAAAMDGSARASADLEARLSRLRSSVDPLGVEFSRLNAELLEAQALYSRGALNATQFAQAEQVLTARINDNVSAQQRLNAAHTKGVGSSKAMTQAGLNLSRQFADIGVTAAMGMNPLMILIQQGPQIADAFAMAKTQGLGFNAVLKGLWASLTPFLPILLAIGAVVGVVAAGFGLLHNQLSKGYPKDITKGLGLTADQLEHVKHKTVTFGDTFMATFTVIGKHIMNGPIGDALKWLGDSFQKLFDWIATSAVSYIAKFIAFWVAAYTTITKHWRNFPQAIAVVMTNAVNLAIGAIEWLVNGALGGINRVIEGVNKIPGIELPKIDPVSITRIQTATEGVAGDIQDTFAESFNATETGVRRAMGNIANEIQSEAIRRARARALKEASKGSAGPKGFDRAGELSKVNRELDNEISRMRMLSDAREEQNRLDQIAQTFAQRGVPLTEAETAALRTKIHAIEEYKSVQSEMDRIYEAAIGPLRTYNAVVSAAGDLLSRGAITQQRHDEEVRKAARTYEDINDPLAQYNRNLADQQALLGRVGIASRVYTEIQSVQNDLAKEGKVLSDERRRSLETELTTLERGKLIQTELESIYASSAGAIETLTARTVALSVAHGQGLVNSEQYRIGLNNIAFETANVALRMKEAATAGDFMFATLGGYMQNYQGMLPGLSSAFGDFFTTVADGFANSIGQAIVGAKSFGEAMQDVAKNAISGLIGALIKLGIQWAITKALGTAMQTAQVAVGVASGAAMAAAWAPAAAMVSLATFGANSAPAMAGITATYGLTQALALLGGFKEGGYTGGGGINDVAGVVHGKEYVFDAASTAAIGVDNLDAMRRNATSAGSSGGGGGGAMGGVNVTIENYGTSKDFEVQQLDEGRVRIIARDEANNQIARKTPELMAAEVGNPNSKFSKAQSRSTTAQRRR